MTALYRYQDAAEGEMPKWMRWMFGILTVLGILIAVPIGMVGSAFWGIAPLTPDRQLTDRVTTVVDLYVACFLVDVGGGKYLLVDGCQDPRAVDVALSMRAAEPSDVELVLLTHSHEDHLGFAKRGGVEVRAMAAAIPRLEGREAHLGPVPRLKGAVDTGVRVARPLADGERFTVGEVEVVAYAIPGHTAGSAAFLIDGVLFLGDSAAIQSDGRLEGAPWVFTDDVPTNHASLVALGSRLDPAEVRWLAPAHTGASEGLAPLASFAP